MQPGHSQHRPARNRTVYLPLSAGRFPRSQSRTCSWRSDILQVRARVIRVGSVIQISGRNSCRPTMTGISCAAKVRETMIWQLPFSPRDEAYCGATPTEYVLFSGKAVSSTISNDRRPPTRRSAWSRRAASSGALSHTPALTKRCSRSYGTSPVRAHDRLDALAVSCESAIGRQGKPSSRYSTKGVLVSQ